jgi:hypothetical protein
MEFIGKSLPPSSIQNRDETRFTFGIENATSQLEENCREVEAAIQADDSQANPAWDSLELYTEAKNRLGNERHTWYTAMYLLFVAPRCTGPESRLNPL